MAKVKTSLVTCWRLSETNYLLTKTENIPTFEAMNMTTQDIRVIPVAVSVENEGTVWRPVAMAVQFVAETAMDSVTRKKHVGTSHIRTQAMSYWPQETF